MVLAPKKDGGIRFCTDYRGLNKVTIKDVYPLPLISETLDQLGKAKFFTLMDARAGYWQVKMKEEDIPKTAFATHRGLWEWICMPFGLTNAPATFQRMMNMVLHGLTWRFCLVYVDDIMVYSATFEEHLEHIQQVLDRLRAHNIRLHPGKCHFCQKETGYLGHVISADGVQVDHKKTDTIRTLKAPRSMKELRGFLGMTGYYRRFIDRYAEIALPLTNLLKAVKDGVIRQWSPAAQQAFETLKVKLCEAPILRYPDFGRSFCLYTDASRTAIAGGVDSKG